MKAKGWLYGVALFFALVFASNKINIIFVLYKTHNIMKDYSINNLNKPYQTVNGISQILDRIDEAWDSYVKSDRKVKSALQHLDAPQDNIAAYISMVEACENKSDESWSGVKGLDEYKANLYDETKAPKFADNIFNGVRESGVQVDQIASVSGEFGDVASYLAGVPECMYGFEEQEANNYLTVYVNAAVPASYELKDMQKRAKQLAEYVNTFELNGTRCRIVLLFQDTRTRQESYNRNSFKWIIKDYEENYIPSFHGYLLGDFSSIRCVGYAYWGIFSNSWRLGTQRESGRPSGIQENDVYVDLKFMNDEAIAEELERVSRAVV